ncbi:MAG: serine hydrolase domain-containing protein, partial [Myxococcota bacterium]
MRNIARLCFATFAVAVVAACAGAPAKTGLVKPGGPDDVEAVRAEISALIVDGMKQNGVTGVSIAVVDDQQVLWADGFGWADREAGVRATPETVYVAGSVSKLFTATAVMKLSEKGLLDIDRPFVNYVPEFSIKTRFKDAPPFTLRQMLIHHSGLPGDHLNGIYGKTAAAPSTVLKALRDEYMAGPPGRVMGYSNLAYSLLGVAVERVSGKEFAGFIDEEILWPLGMKSSHMGPDANVLKSLAKPYRGDVPKAEGVLRDAAAGGLHTTVLDLARFMSAMFRGGEVISPVTLRQMQTVQNGTVPLDFDLKIGLGWFLTPVGGLGYAGRTAWHDGATIFYRASFITLPDHRIGAIALSNSATANALLDDAATGALKILLERRKGLKPPAVRSPEKPAVFPTRSGLKV